MEDASAEDDRAELDGFGTLLEEFGSVIAHELATPLAIINGAAGLALEHDADTPVEEHRALLRTIRRNTELAELLLHRIGLARDIEAGTVELSRTQVDLGRLVEESVNDLRQVILGKHPVSVTVEPMPPSLRIRPRPARSCSTCCRTRASTASPTPRSTCSLGSVATRSK